MRLTTLVVTCIALLAATVSWSALGAEAPADPASAVGKAGQAILDATKGQTYIEAFAKTNSPTNPFGIELKAVATAIGATAVSGATTGAVAGEGQLSILPQFNTPRAEFGVSDVTPAIIPYAALVEGKCIGGYVTGYPAPDRVIAVDMSGRECSAAEIDRVLAGRYPLAVAITHSTQSSAAAPGASSTGLSTAEPVDRATLPDTSFAGDTALAKPGSDIDKVGQVILEAVNGRTVKQALDAGASRDNPFELEADPLLLAAGAYFISTSNTEPLAQSEFSIFPDYVTPGGGFEASETTPPIMPFAFNRGGICHGGYVTGYPVPDSIYAVDMHGKVCNAAAVDDMVHAAYNKLAAAGKPDGGTAPNATGSTTAPGKTSGVPGKAEPAAGKPVDNSVFDGRSASDHDLEMLVYAAYTGAYNEALKHDNYFTGNDLSFSDLRDAIRMTLDKAGYGAADVETQPFDNADGAKTCAADGGVHVRVAFNGDGAGISVVAVSGARMAAYEYYPDRSSDLSIVHARRCLGSGGSASIGNSLARDRLIALGLGEPGAFVDGR